MSEHQLRPQDTLDERGADDALEADARAGADLPDTEPLDMDAHLEHTATDHVPDEFLS